MLQTPVYMDNHSTTPVDRRVVDAMLPYFSEIYGNAGSTNHVFGWDAKEAVDAARESIARALNAAPREIVFTSGATESNNLAIRGVCERVRRQGDHILTVATEHRAVLDPVAKLGRRGFDVTVLPVRLHPAPDAGIVDLDRLAAAIRPDTVLVSVMLANNEIGAIPQLAEMGRICRQHGVLLHSDATQAVGRMPVDVEQLQVDLLSFSAHKIYGPKGVGGLYVRRRQPTVRLESQIDGGRQQRGMRSGTANVPGVVGMATALALCQEELAAERDRQYALRNRLYQGLVSNIDEVSVNGPALERRDWRLEGNLNCRFARVEGEALMMSMRDLAVSSGSACTATDPAPSHVLRALGLTEEEARASLRFGLGRFTTEEQVDFAIATVTEAVARLRKLVSG